jgi:hypothetical protein
MPKEYSPEAVETARKLYCHFGGMHHDNIELEMQKTWPGWKKLNLIDRGKGKNFREGWITKFGFANSLKLASERKTESVNNDEQSLYLGIKKTREALQVKVHGGTASKDEIYGYRDFCRLEIEARKNLDLSRDNFDTFVSGYEKLVAWLSEKDAEVARLLIKNGEYLAERAEAHYGSTQEVNGGTVIGEDASGEQPLSNEAVRAK